MHDYHLTYKAFWQTCSGQDGVIYGDWLFRFDGRGDCTVFSRSAHAEVSRFTLNRTDLYMSHSNSVSFGRERFQASDEFPLLYTNLYNNYSEESDRREGICCVYRLTRDGLTFSTELVQLLRIGFVEDRPLWKSKEDDSDIRPYGNFAVDAERGRLYAFVMRDRDRLTRYFEFNLPALSDGAICPDCGARIVTLNREDILSQFDGAYAFYLQGACCHGGILYSIEGGNVNEQHRSNPPRLQIMDVVGHTQLGDIALTDYGLCIEPEFIEYWDGQLYYSDSKGMLYAFTLT